MTRLRFGRIVAGMTLAEAGRRTRIAKGDLSKWERGKGRPYPAAAKRLAMLLSCRATDLLDEIPAREALPTLKSNMLWGLKRKRADALHRMDPWMLRREIGEKAARNLISRWSGWRLPTRAEWRRFERGEGPRPTGGEEGV